jgi:nicotinamide riboside transporter PnuC
MEKLLWIVSLAALIGAGFNAKGLKWGFLIWAITDSIWGVVDFNKGIYAQTAQQVIYVIIDLTGFIYWTRKGRAQTK